MTSSGAETAVAATSRAALLKRAAVVGAAAVGAGSIADSAAATDDGPRVFNAYDQGARPDGATDNTAILQGLLDQIRNGTVGKSGGALYFPYVPTLGSVYRTRGLWVPSNTRITADPAVEIRAIGPSLDYRAKSNGAGMPDINASGVFTISSQESAGAAYAHPMDSVEIAGGFTINANGAIAHCLEFMGATNVRVSNVSLINGASDNVMFEIRNGNNVSGNQNANVILSGCQISTSGRNCVSLTSFRWVTLSDCTIQGANGFPSAGIDVEPNFASDPIRGLIVRFCQISFNGAQGILFNPPANGGLSTENTDHLLLGNAILENHNHAIEFSSNAGQSDWKGTVRLIGNAITRVNSTSYAAIHNDGTYPGVTSHPASGCGYNLIVVGNHLDGYSGYGGNAAQVVGTTGAPLNFNTGVWP